MVGYILRFIWGNIGIMEKKMEIALYRGNIGVF